MKATNSSRKIINNKFQPVGDFNAVQSHTVNLYYMISSSTLQKAQIRLASEVMSLCKIFTFKSKHQNIVTRNHHYHTHIEHVDSN